MYLIFLGEKGIGFKSVFIVCKKPQVFSGDYAFEFDEEPHPKAKLGYIIPTRITSVPYFVQELRAKYTTVIVLPLKHDKVAAITKELMSITPESLLFLTKLRGLKVECGNKTLNVAMAVKEQTIIVAGTSILEKTIDANANGDSKQYLQYISKIAIPKSASDEKRENVTSSQVSIAFCLNDSIPSRNVYAFLPTEVNSSLPFLLHADFIVPSSRESILFYLPWNKNLKKEIGALAINVLKHFLSKNKELFFKFFPSYMYSGNEFYDIYKDCIAKFSNFPCVPTDQGDVCPCNAIILSTSEHKLFANLPSCRKYLSKRVVAQEFSGKHSSVLHVLKVDDFSSQMLLDLLETGWPKLFNASQLLVLLSHIYEHTGTVSYNRKSMKLLEVAAAKQIPLIPTSLNPFILQASTNSKPIYEPTKYVEQSDEFTFVSGAFLKLLQENYLGHILSQLNVKPLNLENYVKSRIEKIKYKSQTTAVIMFLFEKRHQFTHSQLVSLCNTVKHQSYLCNETLVPATYGKWKDFFSQHEAAKLDQVPAEFYSDLESYDQQYMVQFLKDYFGVIDFPDMSFPSFVPAIFYGPINDKKRKMLISWLEHKCPKQHSHSSVLESIAKFPWLATTSGTKAPNSTYHSKLESTLKPIFGSNIHFAVDTIDLNLASKLGIRCQVSSFVVLNHFESLEATLPLPELFEIAKTVYLYLFSNSSTISRVLVHRKDEYSWKDMTECVWSCDQVLFPGFFPLSSCFENRFESVFKSLGVRSSPTAEDYVSRWIELVKNQSKDQHVIRTIWSYLFHYVTESPSTDTYGMQYKSQANSKPKNWQSFLASKSVLAHIGDDQKLHIANKANVFFADSAKLQHIFPNLAYVHHMNHTSHHVITFFEDQFGIMPISKCVKIKKEKSDTFDKKNVQKNVIFTNNFIWCIMAYMHSKHKDLFVKMKQDPNSVLFKLCQMKEKRLESLTLVYTVKYGGDMEETAKLANAPVYLDLKKGKCYYVGTKNVAFVKDLAAQIAPELLSKRNDVEALSHYISALFGHSDTDKIVMTDYRLPEDEEKFFGISHVNVASAQKYIYSMNTPSTSTVASEFPVATTPSPLSRHSIANTAPNTNNQGHHFSSYTTARHNKRRNKVHKVERHALVQYSMHTVQQQPFKVAIELSEEHAKAFLKSALNNNYKKDLKVSTTDGKSFELHKLVVELWCNLKSGNVDVNCATFELLAQFMYGQSISVTSENIVSIMEAAEKIGLYALVHYCVSVADRSNVELVKQLQLSSCIGAKVLLQAGKAHVPAHVMHMPLHILLQFQQLQGDDFDIHTGTNIYTLPKCFLFMCSETLRSMYNQVPTMSHSEEEIDDETIHAITKYLSGEHFELKSENSRMNHDHVQFCLDMLAAAHYLQIHPLMQLLVDLLAKHAEPEHALTILEMALTLELPQLVASSKNKLAQMASNKLVDMIETMLREEDIVIEQDSSDFVKRSMLN